MREICLVRLDKTRPALVLTREGFRGARTTVTVAPITSTIKGLSSEVLVGPDNGLDHVCAVSLDNVLTVPMNALGRTVGYLSGEQEARLAGAVVLAHDLEVALLDEQPKKRDWRQARASRPRQYSAMTAWMWLRKSQD